jgi:integrase
MTTRGMGGWIEPHHGAHRVRARVDGKVRTVGSAPTHAEALMLLGGFAKLRAAGRVSPSDDVRALGDRWLDYREKRGVRSMASARSRWRCHIDSKPIADIAIKQLVRRDVKEWIASLPAKLSWATRKAVVDLLRGALAWAVDEEDIPSNPAEGLTVSKPDDAHEQEGSTYLLPEEQTALLTSAPRELRACVLLAAFALGTGLRQGEQWNLQLRDLHLDAENPWLVVRWGSKGKPPKSGKMRRVPLFGIALAAAREWVAGLPAYAPENPDRLVFPTPRGCRRQVSKTPKGWEKLVALLGRPSSRHDGRSLRWHDLRHTCASSLVAGWWGRPWRLDEVREMLGHSSVMTTERYAHMAPGVLIGAATGTSGGALGSNGVIPTLAITVAETPCFEGRATHDSNVRPLPSEGNALSS